MDQPRTELTDLSRRRLMAAAGLAAVGLATSAPAAHRDGQGRGERTDAGRGASAPAVVDPVTTPPVSASPGHGPTRRTEPHGAASLRHLVP